MRDNADEINRNLSSEIQEVLSEDDDFQCNWRLLKLQRTPHEKQNI